MLRRYSPLRAGRGTQFPPEVVAQAMALHGGCIGPLVGMPGACDGPIDPDHIRASGALGKKSRSTLDNLAPLCRFEHHRLKTREGRTWRPLLIEAVERALSGDCGHVEPVHGCSGPCNRADPMQLPEAS